ncbi:ABC transporter permease [Streptococcus penaeicida]|uniref:ABC transporter permease n=1 Tax=Streptococcus penaeicida TaxID=1765960 RepID=UPI0039F07541
MFLAINEMKESKLRYSLIVGLLFLVAFLMYFLSGLANGLIQENRSAIDHWKADTVLLSKNANSTLNLSTLTEADKEKVEASEISSLAQMNTVVWNKENPKESDKAKVSLFGIHNREFLKPKMIKGRAIQASNEVIIDQSLAKRSKYKIGDDLYLSNSDQKLKIVGMSRKATFNVSSVVYMTLKDFNAIKSGGHVSLTSKNQFVNAFVIRGKLNKYDKETFQKLPVQTFIDKLPGYQAQIMTFGFMIGFLVVISAIIIGIFMYVLTIQKAPIFGIMKAQGISNKTIANAVISQTFILSILGSSLGLLVNWGTSLFLTESVPFYGNGLFYAIIFISIIIFSILGTLISVFAIVRIDPLKAIG